MLKVKELCALNGITLAALASQIGISAPSLSSAINGNPTLEMLQRIAKALDVELTELFEQTHGDFKCPNCGTALNISVELAKGKE